MFVKAHGVVQRRNLFYKKIYNIDIFVGHYSGMLLILTWINMMRQRIMSLSAVVLRDSQLIGIELSIKLQDSYELCIHQVLSQALE
jgi:hypothetical protein